jgi:O-antigen/teichoic acid export membrane protein
VVNSAFGFFLVPVYTRYLRAGEFGVLSLLTITLTLITIVLKFGLNHAFFRHYYEAEDDGHRRRIIGSTLIFLFFSTAVLTTLLVLAAPYVSEALLADATRADLLKLVFLIGFFDVLTLIPDSILRANFKSGTYSAVNIGAFAFQIILISYLVVFVEATIKNVLIGRLVGSAFEAAVFFVMVRRELSVRFSVVELKGMLAFGFPLIFGQISFTLFMMIDRFFLAHYSTSKALGDYSMANTLVSVVPILVTVPFSQVWTVMRFSVMNEEGAQEYYSRVLTYIVLVGMLLALTVAAAAGDGLLLHALKGYWPAARIIPLLALSVVLDGASRVLNVGITLKKRTIYAPLVIAVSLLVNIGLNVLLIPRYAEMGATISTLISYAVFCGLRYWASNLFFKVRYEWARVFTVMIVGGLLIGAFYATDHLRGDDPSRRTLLASMALKVTLALSFPLILFALRFYDEREIRRTSEIMQKALSMVRGLKWNVAWVLIVVSTGAMLLLGWALASAVSARG